MCGWSRAWHDDRQWLDRKIDHAVYGVISERELVNADITRHTCRQFALWRRRKEAFGWPPPKLGPDWEKYAQQHSTAIQLPPLER